MAQRFEGKSLDEALDHAAETFGVERYQIRHSTLLEKRGFLGGVKRIVIEAEVDSNAADAAPAAPKPVSAPAARSVEASPAPVARQAAAPAPPAARKPRAEGRGRGGSRRDSAPSGGGRGRGRGRRSGNTDERDARGGEVERFTPTEAPEQGAQSDMAKVVRDWVEEVLDLTRIDVSVRTEENETQIHVRLYGRDAHRMIERHGELLDAIQVLANKALTGRKVEKEIELDCEAFKERRTESLEQQAREIADRVRSDGREQLLPAMSPVERRIIHLTLESDADVTTESRGEGFFKRVAVIPRPASAPTES